MSSFGYDHTDAGEFSNPVVGIPTRVTIVGCTSGESQANNPMQILQVKVDQGEEGAGYSTKEYLVKGVNWKIRQVLRAVGLDPEVDREITDVLFVERKASVIFKAEEWAGNDGNLRTSYKIDKWVEAEPTPDIQAPPATEETVDDSVIPF